MIEFLTWWTETWWRVFFAVFIVITVEEIAGYICKAITAVALVRSGKSRKVAD